MPQPPSQCPVGLPAVVLRVNCAVQSEQQQLPSQSSDPIGRSRELARLALHGDPAAIGEESNSDGGYFLIALDGTAEFSIQEAPAEGDSVHVEVQVTLCDAAEVMAGPVAAYRRATSLQSAFGAWEMRWAAWATDFGELWRADESQCREDAEECHTNPQALGEYFSMMGDLSEEKVLIASRALSLSRASVWRFGPSDYRLVLDGVVMSDTRDEHIYHEMLVHPALLGVRAPRQVLVIGGGEGATLRELLKDDRVQSVDMVEINEGLVDLCREHLSAMHRGSFESPKVRLHFEDGAAFLQEAAASSFDAVFVDGVDFQEDTGYGDVLFSRSFYRDVFRVLREGGTMSQYMSHVERAGVMTSTGFRDTVSFTVDVPTFLGAGARFTVAQKGQGEGLQSIIEERVAALAPSLVGSRWSYLDPETMARSFEHKGRRLKGGNSTVCVNNDRACADTSWVVIGIVLLCCCCGLCRNGAVSREQRQMNAAREAMPTSNGPGLLGPWRLQGHYQEDGEAGHATYNWRVDADGQFAGSCQDNDGWNQVKGGKINWGGDANGGDIAWAEVRGNIVSEFSGRVEKGIGESLRVEASYLSNYGPLGTRGTISLTGSVTPQTPQVWSEDQQRRQPFLES